MSYFQRFYYNQLFQLKTKKLIGDEIASIPSIWASGVKKIHLMAQKLNIVFAKKKVATKKWEKFQLPVLFQLRLKKVFILSVQIIKI